MAKIKFSGKDSLNETLYKIAEKAIEDLFNDQSVSQGKARENMRGIIGSTEILLESIGGDLEASEDDASEDDEG